jgi:hypothetical protein
VTSILKLWLRLVTYEVSLRTRFRLGILKAALMLALWSSDAEAPPWSFEDRRILVINHHQKFETLKLQFILQYHLGNNGGPTNTKACN